MKASIGYRCLGPLLTALLGVPCGWLTACETVAKVDRDKLDTHASMSGGTASTSANTGSVGTKSALSLTNPEYRP